MPHYLAYGLTLSTSVEIPGLIPLSEAESRPVDVTITMGCLPPGFPLKSQKAWYASQVKPNQSAPNLRAWQVGNGKYFWLQYREGAEFAIERQGERIWACWQPSLTLEDAATYLLGPVLGFTLRLRGVTCLHASAVAISGQAVLFVGRAGAGKSTTAAAFAKLGYPILSDDVAALHAQNRQRDGFADRTVRAFEVQPAYPRLRLWPKSVEALYGHSEYLPRLVPSHPTWDKRYLDLQQEDYRFQADPLPLGRIYLLAKRSRDPAAPWIEKISMQAGMMALVANTYTNYLLDRATRALEFRALSQLILSISVRQIHPHLNLTFLPQLVREVLSDLET